MAMLTKAQWQKGPRRSGTYSKYVKWYSKYVAPPKNPLAPWTKRQMDAEAANRVRNVFQAQQKQLEDERASRVATIAASSKAASQLLQSHAPAVQGAYHLATQDLGQIGGAYSEAMKQRIQAAQGAAADFASQQGAAPVAPAVDAQAIADTVYHGGVALPAANLASEGAAETAFATQQAAIPALQGAWDTRQTEQDYEKQLLELARQRPELTDKIAQQLFENELAKADARIKQQAQNLYSNQFGETTRHHKATERAAARRNQISYQSMINRHQDAIDKAAREGRQPNASLSRAYGYIVDKNGHPILDKNGKHIPVAKSTSAKSQKEKSNAQYQKAVGEAAKMFKDSRPGEKTNDFGDVTKVPPKRAWRWGNAIRYLMNRYGIKRAGARRALIAAGFKPPGNTGSGNPGGTAAATPNYGGRGGQ